MRSVLKIPLALLAGLLAMAALAGLARACGTFPGDEWGLLELQQRRVGWLDDAAVVLSGAAWSGLGWLAVPGGVAGALLASGRRADALLAAATLLAPAINLGLKELAARPRPDVTLALVEETGYAFPSGHAVFAAAFGGALIYLLSDRPGFANGRPALRRAAQGVAALLTLAVGASRVYLGVHWPSDVIGGFLFGALCLAALLAARRAVGVRRWSFPSNWSKPPSP